MRNNINLLHNLGRVAKITLRVVMWKERVEEKYLCTSSLTKANVLQFSTHAVQKQCSGVRSVSHVLHFTLSPLDVIISHIMNSIYCIQCDCHELSHYYINLYQSRFQLILVLVRYLPYYIKLYITYFYYIYLYIKYICIMKHVIPL